MSQIQQGIWGRAAKDQRGFRLIESADDEVQRWGFLEHRAGLAIEDGTVGDLGPFKRRVILGQAEGGQERAGQFPGIGLFLIMRNEGHDQAVRDWRMERSFVTKSAEGRWKKAPCLPSGCVPKPRR